MPAPDSIAVSALARLVGLPNAPVLVDVRADEDFALDPRHLPGAVRRPHGAVEAWAPALAGRPIVVVCHRGLKLGQGVAAWLRHLGVAAESLEGGAEAWAAAGHPMVPDAALPARDARGRTLWVTRARPKVDRVACPWLIRRFVDPGAVVLFVEPSQVGGVAARFGATPFDVEGARWSHEGELCTFDVMVEAFGLGTPALRRLARIVRGADTARHDLEPECAGLLALCLGLSRAHANDLAQLEAALPLFDALYRWCRDATGEAHDWPGGRPARGAVPA